MSARQVKLALVLDGLFEVHYLLDSGYKPKDRREDAGSASNASLEKLRIELRHADAHAVALNSTFHWLPENLDGLHFAVYLQ